MLGCRLRLNLAHTRNFENHMKKQHYESMHMSGCQNYGPFLGTLNIRCRIIIGIQKGTIILTTTQMAVEATNPHTRTIVGGSWDLVAIRVEGFRFMRGLQVHERASGS